MKTISFNEDGTQKVPMPKQFKTPFFVKHFDDIFIWGTHRLNPPSDNRIDFDRVDAETKAIEEEEALQELNEK